MTDAKALPCKATPYGFTWGITDIGRACEINGNVVICIETPRQRLFVRVTPTGLIRVDAPVANAGEVLSVTA